MGMMGRYRLRHDRREIPVGLDGISIGRAGECRLRLEDGLVSRRHARVWEDSGGLFVEDLGSRNGVTVNGRRIRQTAQIFHDDQVGIGLTVLAAIDGLFVSRPEYLSTLPPASVPFGDADVDADVETKLAGLEKLSERELEVLELIALGHTNLEVSKKLFISVKTVETHRARIGEKIGCKSRAELVAHAIKAGLLSR
jgi:DNA-binding CsgD family transcriptional regulator